MNPAPSYSPTDIGLAVIGLVSVVIDLLTAFGVLPALDPATKTTLIQSLTVLSIFVVSAYAYNRVGKHKAAAQVSAAAAMAASAVPEPPHNVV
ncbi:MAG: hypothetical protein DLM66_00115 [Candidatus Dormiibacter spiritus]|nr:MAG: hypothetical protein DLM66_00115 [Candidatus Dormibacteraeota bacterium]